MHVPASDAPSPECIPDATILSGAELDVAWIASTVKNQL